MIQSEVLADFMRLSKIIEERNAEIKKLKETGIFLPFKIGDTVYKICPKCNDRHNGDCNNCAWQGCSYARGCDTHGLWGDGQYPPERCQVVSRKVDWYYVPTILRDWGKFFFPTKKDAEQYIEKCKKGKIKWKRKI